MNPILFIHSSDGYPQEFLMPQGQGAENHSALPTTGFFLALKCPPGSSYSPCANPCPATCLSLNTPRDCPAALPCVEGCECQKGHVLSGTSCVPLSQCGCTDAGGSYYPVRARPQGVPCPFQLCELVKGQGEPVLGAEEQSQKPRGWKRVVMEAITE